jgi:hypothetical protein
MVDRRQQARPLSSVQTPVTASASVAAAESVLGSFRVQAAASGRLPEFPTVGIVVPAYRDGAFLAAALESISVQTYPHWECVVVDDASPEDLGAVVSRYRNSDSRFMQLRHAANGGLPAARNTGVRQLDTDMVVFLDADDMLVPTALENAVAAFAPLWHDPAVAGVYGPVIEVPEDAAQADLTQWRGQFDRGVFDWARYGGECPFQVHAVLVRRSLVDGFGGFDESLRGGAEDWDLWFRMLRHGYRFEPNPHLVGAYRQRRASMVRSHQTEHLGWAARLFDAAEQWALLDPALTVGRGAAAPLSRARLALERARRAASVIAMQVASSGSIEPLRTSEAFQLLDPEGLAEGRWDTVVESARNGALRGLGVSKSVWSELSPVARDKIVRIARSVADEIFCRQTEASDHERRFDATARRTTVDVLFAAESAADAAALVPLLPEADAAVRVAAVDLEIVAGNSGANDAWRAAGIDVVPYHQVACSMTGLLRLIACAPTGPVTADLLAAAEQSGVECHLVRVPGRPPALPDSAGSALDRKAVTPDKPFGPPLATPTARPEATTRSGWRGSDFPTRLYLEDGPIDPESVGKLRALHNKHAGETAVIVGNGPSLNDTELEILTDVPTLGVNAIFLGADRFPKPITYYVVEDTSVFRENTDDIKAFEADWKLFPAMYRPSFSDDEIGDHTVFFRMNAGFYGRKSGTTCHPRFSMDATQRLYCGQSVTAINLQLAYWMGFQRVVLIGMDFSYHIPDDVDRDGVLIISRSDDPNHFHPGYFGAGKSWKDPMLDRVLVNYHLADEVYRASDREIINATEGGKLDIFPRLSLREAIGYDV